MTRRLITTVGTSLLTNRKDHRPWAGWQRGNPLPDIADVDTWLAEADPGEASAETNTLQAINIGESDRVHFLHSDTKEGRFCSERLQRFYRDTVKCREVTGTQLTALGYAARSSQAQRGLKALVNEAIRAVHQAKERSLEPVFCATGGFKAEIALLNLLGALLKVEVYYIHEQFGEIVRLPRLPLEWDTEWVLQEHQPFFEWIDEEPRRSAEVRGRLQGQPDLQPLVEHGEDGYSYLTAAGDLLFQAARERGPRATWPDAVDKSPQEKDGLSRVEHHRPRNWENFVRRLCNIDCVSRVSCDENAYGGAAVKVLDGNQGTIAVRYTVANQTLPLRVETSARGKAQTELVARHLKGIPE